MTPPGTIKQEERDRVRSRQRGRSIALLVVLFALSGLVYAIFTAKVGQQLQAPRPRPAAAP